ncbi:hypothetical protein JQX13_44530 [Archangium violaceum]|uniref:hypothetical protein n=1 Tax=Archangium violaceum TaxID=83451 RepID=UPI00193C3A5C|nr:hypothetical protein [Archangium violaceum]QRK07051.1 hypothetical protein JQX13_44530 [Archangium violaceum]
MTPNIHYKDREIDGERLEFPKDAIYWMGPNVTLRRCTLVFSVAARWLHLLSGSLIDCTIQAKSELKTLPWAPMKLKGCRFKGRFGGNDFGFREDLDERWRVGGIEDCDFSEARLNGCRFFNCDMSTIRLPRWPCFTFMDPRGHAVELGRHEWPGRFRILIEGLAKNPEGTVAETWHAPTVAEKLDTTAQELRAALEKVPWVFM